MLNETKALRRPGPWSRALAGQHGVQAHVSEAACQERIQAFRGSNAELLVDRLVAASAQQPPLPPPGGEVERELTPFDFGGSATEEAAIEDAPRRRKGKGAPAAPPTAVVTPLRPKAKPKGSEASAAAAAAAVALAPRPKAAPTAAGTPAAGKQRQGSGGVAASPPPSRWAGPAFSQSPAPASLPVPSFRGGLARSSSAPVPATAAPVAPAPAPAPSPPPAVEPASADASQALRALLGLPAPALVPGHQLMPQAMPPPPYGAPFAVPGYGPPFGAFPGIYPAHPSLYGAPLRPPPSAGAPPSGDASAQLRSLLGVK